LTHKTLNHSLSCCTLKQVRGKKSFVAYYILS